MNSASWADDSRNIPELSENKDTLRPMPPSQAHISEADSNTIHESGGNSVVLSKPPTARKQSPALYELCGNSSAGISSAGNSSAIKYPSPVALSPLIQSDLMENRDGPTVGRRLSQDQKNIPNSSTSATETKENGGFTSLDDSIDTNIPSLQEDPIQAAPRVATSLGNNDIPLSQLEAEVALIAEERERLQQLQSLAEREADLKRQILARKSET